MQALIHGHITDPAWKADRRWAPDSSIKDPTKSRAAREAADAYLARAVAIGDAVGGLPGPPKPQCGKGVRLQLSAAQSRPCRRCSLRRTFHGGAA